MNCLTIPEIEAYLNNGCSAWRKRAVERHVAQCAACSKALDEHRSNEELLAQIRESEAAYQQARSRKEQLETSEGQVATTLSRMGYNWHATAHGAGSR
jgi:anti-sigma factor RsiW